MKVAISGKGEKKKMTTLRNRKRRFRVLATKDKREERVKNFKEYPMMARKDGGGGTFPKFLEGSGIKKRKTWDIISDTPRVGTALGSGRGKKGREGNPELQVPLERTNTGRGRKEGSKWNPELRSQEKRACHLLIGKSGKRDCLPQPPGEGGDFSEGCQHLTSAERGGKSIFKEGKSEECSPCGEGGGHPRLI